jgi:hypothetical protein
MNKPKDQTLYDRIKEEVERKYPIKTVFQRNMISSIYSRAYSDKYGDEIAFHPIDRTLKRSQRRNVTNAQIKRSRKAFKERSSRFK